MIPILDLPSECGFDTVLTGQFDDEFFFNLFLFSARCEDSTNFAYTTVLTTGGLSTYLSSYLVLLIVCIYRKRNNLLAFHSDDNIRAGVKLESHVAFPECNSKPCPAVRLIKLLINTAY